MDFSGYSGSSTNKTGLHDITEILLKVALNTITLTFCKATCLASSITSSVFPTDILTVYLLVKGKMPSTQIVSSKIIRNIPHALFLPFYPC